jgi:hypothetical protein
MLGAVGGFLGRQYLHSVGWRTGQSGAPPDSPVHHRTGTVHCLVQITFLNWRNWPLKIWSCWRTGQSGAPIRPLARPRVTRDRPLAHRTVRWFLAVRRRWIPENGQLTRSQPGAPDTVRCTTGQSGAPRLRRVLAVPAMSFYFCFFSDSST